MKPDVRKVMTDWRYLLAFGFGSGLSPKAPGTVGTIAALPFYLLLVQFGWIAYTVITLAVLAGGIYLCDRVAHEMDIKDPSGIVLDEFVGVWIALFYLPQSVGWILAGFVLFRVFDIAKPWPVSWLDRHVPGGAGIMLDDVAAGIYALLVIQAAVFAMTRWVA